MSNPPEPPPTPPPVIVCVPMKLDAFRLTINACEAPSRLAPISQPEYANFRLVGDSRTRTKHDVLQPIDLHNTGHDDGYIVNERVTDLATGDPIRNRHGIYLHWILPHFYRTGLTFTQSTPDKRRQDLINKHGYKVPHADDPNSPGLLYRPLPTRWVVVRQIINRDLENTENTESNPPEFEAFVVESDRLRKLADLDSNVDIQVDVSPFIYLENYSKLQVGNDGQSVKGETDHQGEYFIGFKQHLEGWKEEKNIPRVKLSTASTFNPIFTDYQPHNSSVFSMLDNFAYTSDGKTEYLDYALANYYVIGWHDTGNDVHDGDVKKHLEAYFMQLANDELSAPITNDYSKFVIHGAIYNVAWRFNSPVQKRPNVDASQLYEHHIRKDTDGKNYSPVAVGGSPLDALIAIMHTHNYQDDQGDRKLAQTYDSVAQDLLALQTLIQELEEDPDSQLQGVDALHTSCFIPSDGGLHWHVSGNTGADKPVAPSTEELQDLKAVNEYQMFVDLCVREMKSLQWLIWAEWWKWITSGPERGDGKDVRERVNKFVHSYNAIKKKTEETKLEIKRKTDHYINWESAPLPRYYIPKDPSILLCGMKNPWPFDWTKPLTVRLGSQLVDEVPTPPDDFIKFRNESIPKFPDQLRHTAEMLLAEFYNLREEKSGQEWKNPPPLYHDTLGITVTGDPVAKRDNWDDTQAWFPLFVEWEIEYLHIDKNLWGLEEREAYGPPMLRSKIVEGNGHSINFKNTRILSGRELIVPQLGKMLQNAVERLLTIKTPDDDKLLREISETLHRIPFLNITLSGIRDQLATRHRGTHISPTIYDPSNVDGGLPLEEAIEASRGVIDEEALKLINDTTVTPFGNFPNYGSATSPFKPVTHGQFRFTKLNIIDKFGQAVCAINPQRGADDKTSKLYPYISEIYISSGIPSSLSSNEYTWKEGETIHLVPSINQDSRINGHYVKWEDAWVPVTEYDDPIWGWLVVNYADRGLQVFLPDGTFYREIRVREDETSLSVEWLPFEAPKSPKVPRQLRELIDTLTKDPHQLLGIIHAITNALEADAVPYAHNIYAGYLPSITGRPLALVNTGWSLELSHPFYVNQSTISGSEEPGIKEYKFPIKLGDRERTFDGLVGYFCQGHQGTSESYNFKTFYTYFVEEKDQSDTIKLIKPTNYPELTPYYNSPFDIMTDKAKESAEIVKEYNAELDVFAMLVDPFTAIHGYTTCQPIKEIRLPHWSLEQSLGRITAFFHMGPVVMPSNAPPYKSDRKLPSDLDSTTIDKLLKDVPSFPIPSVTIADWAWLQPYYEPAGEEEPSSSTSASEHISFNPFPVTSIKHPPEFNEAPYTAVEGYLYQKTPITKPKPVV